MQPNSLKNCCHILFCQFWKKWWLFGRNKIEDKVSIYTSTKGRLLEILEGAWEKVKNGIFIEKVRVNLPKNLQKTESKNNFSWTNIFNPKFNQIQKFKST